MPEIEKVPIDQITVPEVRASSRMTQEQKEFFERTAEKYGILQPIVVNKTGVDSYTLLAGKSRLEEQEKKGKEKVDAVITNADELDATMMHLAENLARGSAPPNEVADVLKKAEDQGASVQEIADGTGHTRDWVQTYLMISELPDRWKKALERGDLVVGHIKQGLRLPNPQETEAGFNSCVTHGWTVEQFSHYCDRRLEQWGAAQAKGKEQDLEEPPEPEEREQMAKIRTCNACRAKAQAEDMSMMLLCDDCTRLLSYVVDQIGPSTRAIGEIHDAVNYYREHKRKMMAQQTESPNVGGTPERSLAGSEPAKQQLQEEKSQSPSKEELLERIRKLEREQRSRK